MSTDVQPKLVDIGGCGGDDEGLKIATIETGPEEGFSLVLDQYPDSETFGRVYYDDSEVLEGSRAAEVLEILLRIDSRLRPGSVWAEEFARILTAVRESC